MKRAVPLALLLAGGCFARAQHVATVADLPAQARQGIEKNEAYYLGKAKEQAVFTLNCPAEQVTPTIVSTKASALYAQTDPPRTPYFVENATSIATIGVAGCDHRLTYQVLCGPYQSYQSGAPANPDFAGVPCDVIPSGDAARVIDRNSHDQQRLDQEAAAAAADQKRHEQSASH